MVRQGWCSCIVQQLHSPCATFLYYMSILDPPRSGYNHSVCEADRRACIAANVKDENEYTSKHVTDRYKCEYVVIETRQDSAIAITIYNEEIPMVRLSGKDENMNVNICSYSEEHQIPYVAISHV